MMERFAGAGMETLIRRFASVEEFQEWQKQVWVWSPLTVFTSTDHVMNPHGSFAVAEWPWPSGLRVYCVMLFAERPEGQLVRGTFEPYREEIVLGDVPGYVAQTDWLVAIRNHFAWWWPIYATALCSLAGIASVIVGFAL